MTHESEKDFKHRVLEELGKIFDYKNVYEDVYLDETERFADAYVEGPFCDFAIEIENDFEAVFKGIGQSILYAKELDAVPVVIVPEGHVENPEADILNGFVRIVEMDV